jgi:ABC-type transporter Mla subunit MlaD
MTPEERFDKIEDVLHTVAKDIDKQNDSIRSLIVVARTVLDSIKELREDHKRVSADIDKLREAQSATDEKLNILVDTVDRIVRRENHP